MKVLSIRAWYDPSETEIRPGFTRHNEENLNVLRLGGLIVAFGTEE